MALASNWFLKSAGKSSAQIVERPLRGAGADAVAVSEEEVTFGLRFGAGGGEANDDGADGRAGLAFGTRFAGDGDGVGGSGALARSRGHGLCAFFTHRGVKRDQCWIDTEQLRLHGICIRKKSTDEIIGAAGDGSDAI